MIFRFINNILSLFLITIFKIYKYFISPIIKTNCRYYPSCSEYAIIAIKKHGIFFGLYLVIRRILTCHPLGGHGYDPVPKKFNKEN